MTDNRITAQKSQLLIYQATNGQVKIDVTLQDETVWLSQKLMAELFDVDIKTINEHLRNIYNEGELQELSTIRKNKIVQTEGQRQVSREVNFYNLDAIIAVGYRVSSKKATQFRIWANSIIKEYLTKGFALNDERLKQSGAKSRFFQELLQRIRDIRSSERNLYQKITDIYATAIDYDSKNNLTQQFFATVQNKMHYAVHGNTAAELIYQRVDSQKELMGLTNFKSDYVTQYDIGVAKNYLSEKELQTLNLIVSLYLDFAELQALNEEVMTMQEWIQKLDDFLKLSNKDVLISAGKISHQEALEKASREFEIYKQKEMLGYSSDFDYFIQKAKNVVKK